MKWLIAIGSIIGVAFICMIYACLVMAAREDVRNGWK